MTSRFDEDSHLMAKVVRGQGAVPSEGVSTIRNAVERAVTRLRDAGVEEARLDAWLLLAYVRGQDRASLLAHADDPLDGSERRVFEQLVTRRADREPFAQIVGRKEFWSLDFQVSADVLCPRPDSECLIEAALAEFDRRRSNDDGGARILDLGTGTGCLLLALLSELPEATGVGVDVSGAALSMAQGNGRRLGLAQRVHWLGSNWGAALDGRFDLIVSNPPYIADGAKATLSVEVGQFEPPLALFAGEDGLDAFQALASGFGDLLTPRGFVCLEIGRDQADAVEDLLTQNGFRSLARLRDLAGVERCIIADRA